MITHADVEALSRLRSDHWPIVSLILRVDKERIDEDYTIRLKNLLRQAADGLDQAYDHDQTAAVLADLDRIREFFRDSGDQFGKGVAVFASSPAAIWQVHELPRDVESHISVDQEADVAPLIRLLDQLEPFCTCLISRNAARIFYGRLGTFEQLTRIVDEDVPGQHEQGGWSQARYERHIDDHAQRHFKHVADELFRIFNERPYKWLVVGGTDEVTAAFIDTLHPYVRDRHVGTIRTLMEANINDVHQESCDVIRRWVRGDQERAIETLRNEALSGDLGTAGLDGTIDALNQGQLLTLIVDDSFTAPGAICLKCDSIQPSDMLDRAECAYCGGPLKHVDNIVPHIVTGAFRQSAAVVFLTDPEMQDQMRDLGRIGALLRFRPAGETEE